MKVISYSVALLVVIAVAAQAVDVHFCHLNVDMSDTPVKGQVGTMMSAAITYPGCGVVSGVDMTANQFMILKASDDSNIATMALTALTAAAKGANYVLITPSMSGNATFVQPRSTVDIAAGDAQVIAMHAAKGEPTVDVTVNGAKVISNLMYGSDMYLNVVSTALTGDVVAMNSATNATLFSAPLPSAVPALDTVVVAAVGQNAMTGAKEPKFFFNIAGGASGTTGASAAAFTSPAAAVVAVVAAVVSVVAMAL